MGVVFRLVAKLLWDLIYKTFFCFLQLTVIYAVLRYLLFHLLIKLRNLMSGMVADSEVRLSSASQAAGH